jgi:CelD/BcsL family acetyltransferase involved in cellulose biosynthesis
MACEAEWQTLVTQLGDTVSIQHTHHWLTTWLKNTPPDSLLIITVREDTGRLIAATPLMIRRGPLGMMGRMLRMVQFVGTQPTVYDWMDPLLILPEIPVEPVVQALMEILLERRCQWDMLDWPCMRKTSMMTLVQQSLQSVMYRVQCIQTDVVPSIRLPKTVAEFEQHGHSGKTRRELERTRRRLETDHPGDLLRLVFADTPETAHKHLLLMAERHRTYWQARGTRSDFDRFEGLLPFYHDLWTKDCMDLSMLVLGTDVLSYQITFRYKTHYMGHLSNYDSAFKAYRPGILHIEALATHAIDTGNTHYDLGRGGAAYKHLWKPQDEMALYGITAFQTPLAMALRQGDLYLRTTRDYIKNRKGLSQRASAEYIANL